MSQLSSEGRIFARQAHREVDRREKAHAKLLWPGAKDWDAGMYKLADGFMADRLSPVKASALLQAVWTRLEGTPYEERSFYHLGYMRNRVADLGIVTLSSSTHPIAVVGDDESGLRATIAQFSVNRRHRFSMSGITTVFINDHALGRLGERSTFGNHRSAFALLLLLGHAAPMVFRSEKHVGGSISVALDGDATLVGSIRYPGQKLEGGRMITAPFIDFRTVLENEWVDEDQTAQAKMMAGMISAFVDTADPTVWAGLEEMPRVERREDYVMKVIAASQAKPN